MPGPAVLPEPVLEEAQRDLVALPGVGLSVLEVSHRSQVVTEIIETAEANIRTLAGLTEDIHVLFIQGGATQQFASGADEPSSRGRRCRLCRDRVMGQKKATKEAGAVRHGPASRPSTEAEAFARIPKASELALSPDAAYVHVTSNNTIYGTQWQAMPDTGDLPLVVDASSDDLQSAAGHGARRNRPGVRRRAEESGSCWRDRRPGSEGPGPASRRVGPDNSHDASVFDICGEPVALPIRRPVFAIYLVGLVAKWLVAQGGAQGDGATQRAQGAESCMRRSTGPISIVAPHSPTGRSLMNVTMRPPERVTRGSVHQGGDCRRIGGAQGAPVGGWLEGVDLQRLPRGRRRRIGRLHDPVRARKRIRTSNPRASTATLRPRTERQPSRVYPLPMRQTQGSLVCPQCGKLVGISEPSCPYCGTWQPGLFGFAPVLQRLVGSRIDSRLADLDGGVSRSMVRRSFCSLTHGCRAAGCFPFSHPGSRALYQLGMTGGVAWKLGMVVDAADGELPARGVIAHLLQHDVGSQPGTCRYRGLWTREDVRSLSICQGAVGFLISNVMSGLPDDRRVWWHLRTAGGAHRLRAATGELDDVGAALAVGAHPWVLSGSSCRAYQQLGPCRWFCRRAGFRWSAHGVER